ncbi:hypothetical protein DFS34DRAFT_242253 [Phlyctochytrium arcticum]|nr:hypothetical protein DFS34DRAFT_242253 [Phlyctochytrium arcticum]
MPRTLKERIMIVGLNKADNGRKFSKHPEGCGQSAKVGDSVTFKAAVTSFAIRSKAGNKTVRKFQAVKIFKMTAASVCSAKLIGQNFQTLRSTAVSLSQCRHCANKLNVPTEPINKLPSSEPFECFVLIVYLFCRCLPTDNLSSGMVRSMCGKECRSIINIA